LRSPILRARQNSTDTVTCCQTSNGAGVEDIETWVLQNGVSQYSESQSSQTIPAGDCVLLDCDGGEAIKACNLLAVDLTVPNSDFGSSLGSIMSQCEGASATCGIANNTMGYTVFTTQSSECV